MCTRWGKQLQLVSSPKMKREKKCIWDLWIMLVLSGNREEYFHLALLLCVVQSALKCRQCTVCFLC